MTIDISEITTAQIGNTIEFEGVIKKLETPRIQLKTGIMMCRSCRKQYEVEQDLLNPQMKEPSRCVECGGKSFKLFHEPSTFIDVQFAEVSERWSLQSIKVLLYGDNVIRSEYLLISDTKVHITGEVVVQENRKQFELVVVCSELREGDEDCN